MFMADRQTGKANTNGILLFEKIALKSYICFIWSEITYKISQNHIAVPLGKKFSSKIANPLHNLEKILFLPKKNIQIFHFFNLYP